MRHVTRMLLATTAMLHSAAYPAHADAGRTERISVGTGGQQADRSGSRASISGSGRYVAFESQATTLTPTDPAAVLNVFVRDRQRRVTTLVSQNVAGAPGNLRSERPFISHSGRWIVFMSSATNLVAADTNGPIFDVYLRDQGTGQTTLASLGPAGNQGERNSFSLSISGNGRYVAFRSASTTLLPVPSTELINNIFVRDVLQGTTTVETVGPAGEPGNAVIDPANPSQDIVNGDLSTDGRFLAFTTSASNLVPVDGNQRVRDVFLRDRQAGVTTLVSVAADGGPANGPSVAVDVSDDGTIVAFDSDATNLTAEPDTNNCRDVFVRDMVAGVTKRITRAFGGGQTDACTDLVDTTPDGRYLMLVTVSENLLPNDTNEKNDAVRYDRLTDTFLLLSVGPNGEQANGSSFSNQATIANGGQVAVFPSAATNLVPGDTNGVTDIFARVIHGDD